MRIKCLAFSIIVMVALICADAKGAHAADTKGSALSAPSGGPATNDKLYLIDTSAGASRADTVANIVGATVNDTPANGSTTAPVSSNWAYDHAVAADPHTGYCLESVLGTSIGTGLLLDSTTLKVSAILQEYHAVNPTAHGLTLGQLTDPGADGILLWDDDPGNHEYAAIGSGLSYDGTTLTATGTGDVTGVGDCASGACLDGTSDGGSYIRIYDGDSHYGEFQVPDISANVTYTFPAATSTLLATNGSGASLTGIPLDSDFPENGALVRTAAGAYSVNARFFDMTVLTAEPSEVVGQFYIADNDTWDPNTYTGTNDYLVLCTGVGVPGTFVPIMDMVTGDFLIAADSITDAMLDFGSDAGQINIADIPGGVAGASAFDFGGATSVEIVNSDDPDTDAAGEISLDTDGWLRVYNDSRQNGVPLTDTIVATVYKPNDMDDAQRDNFSIWINTSGMSFVVTSWTAKSTSDNTTLDIKEEDGDGQNDATVDAVEIATDGTGLYYATDSTITAATIEDGHILYLDFDDTDTPAKVIIAIKGYYNGDVN